MKISTKLSHNKCKKMLSNLVCERKLLLSELAEVHSYLTHPKAYQVFESHTFRFCLGVYKGMEWNDRKGMEWNGMYLSKGNEWN